MRSGTGRSGSVPLILSGLALVALAGCGTGSSDGNAGAVAMKDVDVVDGTINDAMTDLDGVQYEGTPMADTGNAIRNGAGVPAMASNASAASNATQSEEQAEVVSDQ